jgi:hypothetical protein
MRVVLMFEETDDDEVRIAFDYDAGTCLGRIRGIHFSHSGAYLGYVTPPPRYMALLDVTSIEVKPDWPNDYDLLDIEMGKEP